MQITKKHNKIISFVWKMQFLLPKIWQFAEKAVILHPKSKNNAPKMHRKCKSRAKIQQKSELTKLNLKNYGINY